MLGFLFICILCLFLIGAPIFVALGMGTTLSIMLEGNFPLVLVPQRMFAGLDSWPIMAIPMFMLAGNLMDQGGMSKRIVDFASASIGFVKGSLAMVAVIHDFRGNFRFSNGWNSSNRFDHDACI